MYPAQLVLAPAPIAISPDSVPWVFSSITSTLSVAIASVLLATHTVGGCHCILLMISPYFAHFQGCCKVDKLTKIEASSSLASSTMHICCQATRCVLNELVKGFNHVEWLALWATKQFTSFVTDCEGMNTGEQDHSFSWQGRRTAWGMLEVHLLLLTGESSMSNGKVR